MSRAAATGQVVFTKRFGSFMTSIRSDKGELYQQYMGDWNNASEIIPNYQTAGNQPTLTFISESSRVNQAVTPADNGVDWYINGKTNSDKILFTNGVSSSPVAFAGCFRKVDNTKIKIIDNLVRPAGGMPITLYVVATVNVNGEQEDLQASYEISISAANDKGWRNVNIVAGDGNYMTIREQKGTCVLQCDVYGQTRATLYKWYQLVPSGANMIWQEKQSSTSNTYTVREQDVESAAMFKVTAFNGTDEIGSDQASVLDLSDPLFLNPNPTKKKALNGSVMATGEDALTINDTDEDCYIQFEPTIHRRSDGSPVTMNPEPTYTKVFTDYAGVPQTSQNHPGCIDKQMCLNVGNVSYYITAEV